MWQYLLQKKFIFVIGFILVVIIIGYLLFTIFYKPIFYSSEEQVSTGNIEQLPTANIGTPRQELNQTKKHKLIN